VARRRNIVAKSAQVVSSDSLHGQIGRIEGLKGSRLRSPPSHPTLGCLGVHGPAVSMLSTPLSCFAFDMKDRHFCMPINLELACEACNNACLFTGSRL
jgi:hypothetical protein